MKYMVLGCIVGRLIRRLLYLVGGREDGLSQVGVCLETLLCYNQAELCVFFSPPGCYKITTVFSHAQTVVLCVGCSTVLCQPTGGKARLTEGEGGFLLY